MKKPLICISVLLCTLLWSISYADVNENLKLFAVWASECDYSPPKLAERNNCSMRELQRYFKKHVGKPPYEWLHNLRMQRGYELLISSDYTISDYTMTVKSVGYELKYKQISHFIRDFTKHFGITPQAVLDRRIVQ